MKSTISFLHTKSILTYETSLLNEKTTKNVCKFVKFLHGTMRDAGTTDLNNTGSRI